MMYYGHDILALCFVVYIAIFVSLLLLLLALLPSQKLQTHLTRKELKMRSWWCWNTHRGTGQCGLWTGPSLGWQCPWWQRPWWWWWCWPWWRWHMEWTSQRGDVPPTHLPATCHCLYFAPTTLQYVMYASVVVSQSNQFTQYKHRLCCRVHWEAMKYKSHLLPWKCWWSLWCNHQLCCNTRPRAIWCPQHSPLVC